MKFLTALMIAAALTFCGCDGTGSTGPNGNSLPGCECPDCDCPSGQDCGPGCCDDSCPV